MTALRSSQLGVISVSGAPSAAGLRVSQLGIIVVSNIGQPCLDLGPVVGLGCWTPCANLLWDGRKSNDAT